jgi:GNAT-like C-terminal domain/N-acyltransferase N-terminal domain
VAGVLDLLRADGGYTDWLDALEAVADADGAAALPAAFPDLDDLPGVLLDLAVPHEDINALVEVCAEFEKDRELSRLLGAAVRILERDLGTIGRQGPLPVLPDALGPAGRYFHVLAFVAVLPRTRAYHRRHGVPDEVSRSTLADLGRQMAVHRRRRGTGGLLTPWWLTLHFRGELYQLGRLQFQRSRLGDHTGRAVAEERPVGPGDPALEVHIPDFRGRLSPAACANSFARAREFFPRHFPEENYSVATCTSWLLDPQLLSYLPEHSNITAFQRLFTITDPGGPDERGGDERGGSERGGDDTVPIAFVFGDPELPLETLPRHTSVQRALVDHLRSGRHWYVATGYLAL